MRLAFADTAATIEAPEDEAFLQALCAAAPGWAFARSEAVGEPVATVRLGRDGYELIAPDGSSVSATAVASACSALVDLVGAYNAENPARFCFHCGAADFAGRLVVFPSRARAGKSTLIARLAAAGHAIFCDDILPVSEDDCHGVALGIAPRLRLPLPAGCSKDFRIFVESHAAVSDGRYLYLRPPGEGLAPRNSLAPLGAIVLLDRRDSGPALLGRASRAEVLRALIVQNFARAAPSSALLDRMHAIMDRLPRLILRYSDLEEAVELLEQVFCDWPPKLEAVQEALASGDAGDELRDGEERLFEEAFLSPDASFLQNRGVRLQEADGELFLADADGMSVHHLNALGAGVWNLLSEPISHREACEVLCGAFPDADPGKIGSDVARLFAALAREQLIVPAPAD